MRKEDFKAWAEETLPEAKQLEAAAMYLSVYLDTGKVIETLARDYPYEITAEGIAYVIAGVNRKIFDFSIGDVKYQRKWQTDPVAQDMEKAAQNVLDRMKTIENLKERKEFFNSEWQPRNDAITAYMEQVKAAVHAETPLLYYA